MPAVPPFLTPAKTQPGGLGEEFASGYSSDRCDSS